MNYKLSNDLLQQLYRFNQRKLTKAELVLLARAICDVTPLTPPDETNTRLYLLSKKNFINSLLYTLCNYIYLEEEDFRFVFDTIVEFMTWREEVAYRPGNIIFSGDADTVIDDLSLLPNFVLKSKLCEVAKESLNANYYYRLFLNFAKEYLLYYHNED